MGNLDPHSLSVYVVTSSAFGRDHREVALAAIEGGATALQLRAPELGDDELARLAGELAERCLERRVLFVVNDRPEVAAACGAGAHVGRSDDPATARAVVGDGVLGISVSTPEEALAAERSGADYVGVTVWATPTKPEGIPGGLESVRSVADAIGIPVVGIGGIDARNAAEVVAAGAAGVAVISAVAAAPDPVAATKELAAAVAAAQAELRGGGG